MSETITIVTLIFESVFASLETLVTHIMGCDDRPFETGVVWSQYNGLNQAHIFRGG